MDLRKIGLLGVAFLTVGLSAQAGTITAVFSSTNGGFTSTSLAGSASWAHTTAWNLSGANSANIVLTSPTLTASGGQVTLQFEHSYNFESSFDGGQVELSLNGGAFTDLPGSSFSQNGYNRSGLNNSFVSVGFNGSSGGFLTSVATLATLNFGDTYAFRFQAGYDGSVINANPNWSLRSVTLTNTEANANFADANAIPEPGTTALVALGFGALFAYARRRKQK